MHRLAASSSHLVLAGLIASFASALPAQCTREWLPGDRALGTNEHVRAVTTWDPDGAGPEPLRVAMAGHFTVAGQVAAAGIATWEPTTSTWAALGTGITGIAYSLATLPSGELVVGGQFATAGGAPASNVARWNGTTWAPLGLGTNGPILSLATLANGDLIAAGDFTTAGGVAAAYIARWDGVSWAPLGSGMDARVFRLHVRQNGDLVAGGVFTTAGGVAASSIARWDGAAWHPLGTGVTYPTTSLVSHLASMPNGDLVAGGQFITAGGVAANRVARWDGAAWHAMGAGLPNGVDMLATRPNGDVIASSTNIVRWDGTAWVPALPGLMHSPSTMTALPNGDLIAGGTFKHLLVVAYEGWLNIARWDGANWVPLGSGLNGDVTALTAMPNGDVVAAGIFTSAGPFLANNIARWTGASWSPLGSGIYSHFNSAQYALAALPNGDVVAGGRIGVAGGIQVNQIARWDGQAWHAMGAGLGSWAVGAVAALAVMPNGDLIAGGSFSNAGATPVNNIARWDGASWSALGAGVNGGVAALAVLADGSLVATGQFTSAGGVGANHIARWNGTTWSPLGSGLSLAPFQASGRVLTALPNGDVVVAGSFSTAGGVPATNIAKWNGTAWSPLGAGINTNVVAVQALPNGDVVAAPQSLSGSFVQLLRWNGATWSVAGDASYSVSAFAVTPSGDLVAGGSFLTIGGQWSRYIGRLRPTCPATAVPYGSGCAGAGGVATLTATALPWLGSTYRAEATGMPPFGFVAVVTGFTQLAIPLGLALPQALPTCLGLVTADAVDVLLPSAGVVTPQLTVPANASLTGAQVHQYVVPFELGGSGQVTAITSSNALTLTVGSL